MGAKKAGSTEVAAAGTEVAARAAAFATSRRDRNQPLASVRLAPRSTRASSTQRQKTTKPLACVEEGSWTGCSDSLDAASCQRLGQGLERVAEVPAEGRLALGRVVAGREPAWWSC